MISHTTELAHALHEQLRAYRSWWLPITGATPIGAKVQLLGKGGVPAYGAHSPRCEFFTHWAPLPKRLPADISQQLQALVEAGQRIQLNADKTVVISLDCFWLPISHATPLGIPLQLLGRGGVATYGQHSPRESFFTHWARLPEHKRSADE